MIRNEETRMTIIRKTAPIFNRQGYVGTYLSDLTKATGLSKGSIYGNFKDKNEVAVEAFRYNYRFQTARIHEVIGAEQRADKKLLAFLSYYEGRFREIFENGGCAILNTAVDADDGNEALKMEVTEKIHSWKNSITGILRRGIELEELEAIDVDEFAYYLISMIEGSILLAKTLDNPRILLNNIRILKKNIAEITI